MYDVLSADYDRFVNWQNRLAFELPFIIEKLNAVSARQVLDAATGTGMHAIALAQCGFSTAGADLSQAMISRAIANAESAGVRVRFEPAGFGSLSAVFGKTSFDAILCLGNSLPHLLDIDELTTALEDFADCLKPGGLLLVQNRNFDVVMQQRDRWMELQSATEGDTEWVFQRFYDFEPDGLVSFNMVILKRVAKGSWSQSIITSRLRPLLKAELISCLESARFGDITTFGNMAGAAFDAGTSPSLVVLARMPTTQR